MSGLNILRQTMSQADEEDIGLCGSPVIHG